jgi:hypothetical protein
MNINSLQRSGGTRLLALALALALAGCGGGGGNPGAVGGTGSGSTGSGSTGGGSTGGGTTVTTTPTVSLSFATTGGQASNVLSSSTPLIASATVKDKDGKPVPNALVSFAADNTLVLFTPSAGTALTNASGVASVTLRPASLAAGGAGKVTATTSVAGATVSGEANVSVGATALSMSELKLDATRIEAYGSTVVSVDVLANGVPYTEQQLTVNFSSTCVDAGKATLAPTVRTINGTAKAVYRDQGCGTTDFIAATTDGVARPSSKPLEIVAPAAASVQFTAADPVERSIVIAGNGGIGRTETATLKFKVVDIFNRPLAGQHVDFSIFPTDMGIKLNKPFDTSDQNGEVITTVNSGSLATTFRVKASLAGGVSTVSDSVVVTTGLPVKRSLTLSSNVKSIEAAYNGASNAAFTMMLADDFSNPVPDGAPVVFQTNMGAIGTSDKGGCNTVNGSCSVPFIMQNPDVATPNTPATPCNNPYGSGTSSDSTRPGLATICASTNDGAAVLFTKTTLFLSGSFANNTYVVGSGAKLSSSSPYDLGSVQFQQPMVFALQINDKNLNPMPTGTTVTVSDLANARLVGVQPAAVQNIFPHTAAGDDPTGNSVNNTDPQGSYHTFTIASTIAEPCNGDRTATFNVVIETPKKNVTTYPFKLKFTCS